MEEKINIAEILKDKPQRTKLYSPICGEECLLSSILGNEISIEMNKRTRFYFSKYGTSYSYPKGEVLLFPSKEMRDWSKFAWKKGDVLVCTDGKAEVIFERFDDDNYTSFVGKHYLESYGKDGDLLDYEQEHFGNTANYTKESDKTVQCYINTIEERLGGKLNRETLEIEKTQPEFKDGDILFVKCEERDFIEIFNYSKKNGDLCDYASLDTLAHHLDISGKYKIGKEDIVKIRLATESEKQQLFDALAKKGKTWDAEKKAMVDLPKKCEFKAMDWCLMRDKKETWKLCQFSFFDDGGYEAPYNAVGGNWFDECIPYNEETKHLLGTTDEWKGGEG